MEATQQKLPLYLTYLTKAKLNKLERYSKLVQCVCMYVCIPSALDDLVAKGSSGITLHNDHKGNWN